MTIIEHALSEQFNSYLSPVLSSPTEYAHFSGERIMHTSEQFGHTYEVHVILSKGQTAWNPASTKVERMIVGPAVVIYQGLTDRSGIRVVVF